MAIEKPKYEVMKKQGNLELRSYLGYITAGVKIRAETYNEAVNTGFGYLADYIFGNNHISEKIAMTTPVNAVRLPSQKIAMTAPVNAQKEGDSYLVTFTMPSKYTIASLPIPNRSEISINEIKPFLAVAICFSGYLTDEKAKFYEDKLDGWIEQEGLEPHGAFVSSQFDPPWMPWFIRHNEIYREVKLTR